MEWTTLAQLQPSLRRGGAIAAAMAVVGAAGTCLLIPDVPPWAAMAWVPVVVAGLRLRATVVPATSTAVAWRVAYVLAAIPAWIAASAPHSGAGSEGPIWLLGAVLCLGYGAGSRALAR